MARIIDESTRIIDVDFGSVETNFTRPIGTFEPSSSSYDRNGADELLLTIPGGNSLGGSFIQYKAIDLSFMTKSNTVMQPVNVSVQRTSPVPLGYSIDGNNFDQIEEYIYIFTRPLNNARLIESVDYNLMLASFRCMGLDSAQDYSEATDGSGLSLLEGFEGGWPNLAQTLYAEKRMYNQDLSNAATKLNGALTPTSVYNAMLGMPTLASLTSWGSMSSITGPILHCYRVVIDRSQTFPAAIDSFESVDYNGSTQRIWPPVNVSFLCKDPNFNEGEYLTRIANAMNSVPEGGALY